MLKKPLGVFFALIFYATASGASLVGDEILVEEFYPNLSTPCGFGQNTWQFTVAAGASDQFTSCGGGVDVNVEGDSVLITKNNNSPFGGGDFGGFVFSSLNWVPIDGILVDVINATPTVTPVVELTVLGDHSFLVNVAGLFWSQGSVAELQLVTRHGVSPVPIPAAVWLFGTALIGFVGVSRRRKVA